MSPHRWPRCALVVEATNPLLDQPSKRACFTRQKDETFCGPDLANDLGKLPQPCYLFLWTNGWSVGQLGWVELLRSYCQPTDLKKEKKMTRKKLASGVGLALLALAIVPPSVALAADPVFVDANLEACVVATVGHSPVTEADALALSDLVCDGLNISNLAGLEGFTNLNSLSLRDNGITSIAQLASMTALASVDLGENMITDVSPLAGLGRIQQIFLDKNWITDLRPLSPRMYALVTAEDQWPPGFSGFVGQPFGMYTI